MTVNLTPAQQRRMQKLAAAVDRASQADGRFFKRFPERRHRVRLANQAEIEQLKILSGAPVWVPPDCWTSRVAAERLDASFDEGAP